jgi:hypothetical protein
VKPIIQAVPGAVVQLLRAMPLSDGKVKFAWAAAVGPALERVTTVKLERRVLIVEATSAQWSRAIEQSSAVILPRLQSLLGTDVVASISVRT